MPRIFKRPHIVVSKCIEFEPCRNNGDIVTSHIVLKLKEHVDFIPVCPEVEIGLGIPRPTLRIVRSGDDDHLIQPETGRDVSEEMNIFSQKFLGTLPAVEGFILKNKSPTSGIRDVKVYPSAGKSGPVGHAPGFFGREIIKRFPFLPVEDEGRLRNIRIRDHFLTRIFSNADFHQARKKGRLMDLLRFHNENRYLLIAHSRIFYDSLERLVGKNQQDPVNVMFDRYGDILFRALMNPPTCDSNIEVLLQAFGHFKGKLTSGETGFFLRSVDRYRKGTISLCGPKNIIALWIARENDHLLGNQTFFYTFSREPCRTRTCRN
ncbi:MAG: DUF523 and DUF1722 domain-containing protein [Methanoregulaceae archaeon]|nr:DUF523 and DUF1722 domain-containing protein [Methanoregulaceae archaeon]